MSHHFQKEIAFLGIESSPALVRVPEGNGCAERFIRTLKESLLWVRSFATVEELRLAPLAFREVYNTTWLIERCLAARRPWHARSRASPWGGRTDRTAGGSRDWRGPGPAPSARGRPPPVSARPAPAGGGRCRPG